MRYCVFSVWTVFLIAISGCGIGGGPDDIEGVRSIIEDVADKESFVVGEVQVDPERQIMLMPLMDSDSGAQAFLAFGPYGSRCEIPESFAGRTFEQRRRLEDGPIGGSWCIGADLSTAEVGGRLGEGAARIISLVGRAVCAPGAGGERCGD